MIESLLGNYKIMLLSNNSKNDFFEPINNSFSYIKEMLAEYSDVKDFEFYIPDVRNTTKATYQQYISILEKAANCIKNMNDDIQSNPWRNTVLESRSPGLILRFEDCKDKVSDGLQNLVQLCTNLREDYSLRFENTFNGIRSLSEFIFLACESPVVPKIWFESEKIESLKSTAVELRKLQNDYFQNMSDIKLAVTNLKKLNPAWKFDIKNLSNLDDVIKLCKDIEKIIDSNICFTVLNTDPSKESLITSVEQEIKENNYLKMKVLADFNESIFTIDARTLEARFKQKYNSFRRYIKPAYYNDKKIIAQHLKDPKHPLNSFDIQEICAAVRKITENKSEIAIQKNDMLTLFPDIYDEEKSDWDKIHALVAQYKNLMDCHESAMHLVQIIKKNQKDDVYNKSIFGKRYKGFLTDWEDIQSALEWTDKMIDVYLQYTELYSPFMKSVCSDPEYLVSLKFYAENITEILDDNLELFVRFADYFEDSEKIINSDIEEVERRFEECCVSFQLIDVWADYKALRAKATEMGIGQYFKIIEEEALTGEEIVPVFEKRFINLWNKAIMAE